MGSITKSHPLKSWILSNTHKQASHLKRHPALPVPMNSNIKVGNSGKFLSLAILIALT